jgi:hypothetical protein
MTRRMRHFFSSSGRLLLFFVALRIALAVTSNRIDLPKTTILLNICFGAAVAWIGWRFYDGFYRTGDFWLEDR